VIRGPPPCCVADCYLLFVYISSRILLTLCLGLREVSFTGFAMFCIMIFPIIMYITMFFIASPQTACLKAPVHLVEFL
jgi:hypothetical protein